MKFKDCYFIIKIKTKMITDTVESNQLPINTNESFKSNLKICQNDGCEKPCVAKAKYCQKHKKGKKCKYKDCGKRPHFNYKELLSGLYCVKHKKDNMVNVTTKKCEYINCNKIPNFNFEGENPIYCFLHKQDGMIDVKHKKCKFEGCEKRPTFNLEGNKPLYCSEHKEKDMVNITMKKCEYIDCDKIPSFNFESEKTGIYCFDHKKEDMINVLSRKCKSEWCYTQVAKKYKGYCLFCFFNLYPDSPIFRNHKTKEKSVIDFVKENFEDYDWIEDKRIKEGCSKRRPDIMLDFGSHIIIIEIDENAHANYDCSCENKRLMEISKDLGHRPIVFIRFNPDSYIDKDSKKIKSCWSSNKQNGILYINNKKQWKYRLECLKDQVEYWIKNETKRTIKIIQMFYDEN